MECNVVSIWASFDWNVSKMSEKLERRNAVISSVCLKIHTYELSLFHVLLI